LDLLGRQQFQKTMKSMNEWALSTLHLAICMLVRWSRTGTLADTSVLWLLQQIEETALSRIMAALDDNQPASAADLK